MNLDEKLRKGAISPPSDPLKIEHIPVVMSFTEDVATYAYTTMLSALRVALPGVRLAFYVLYLEGELSQACKEQGKRLLKTRTSDIHFIDLSAYLEDFDPPRFGHMPRNIFFRLAIPALFSKFNRVIFLDGDTFVRRCVSLLYYSLNRHTMIAATRDLLLESAIKSDFHMSEELGGEKVQDYQKTRLGIANPQDYFQGGVVVFNIQNIPQEKAVALWEEAHHLFWMMDQDILNKVFHGNVQYLIPNWNICLGNGCLEASENLSPEYKGMFEAGREDPCIIHFTGWPKPWNGWDGPWSDDYRKLLSVVQG